MDENISLAMVKQICQIYDMENGNYPESQWEGRSLFERILLKLQLIKNCPHCDKPMRIETKYSGGNAFEPKEMQYVFWCYACEYMEVI